MAWFSSFMLHGAALALLFFAAALRWEKEMDLADSGNVVPVEVVATAEITDVTNIAPIAPLEPPPELAEIEEPEPEGAPQTAQAPPRAEPEAIPLPAKEKQKQQPKKQERAQVDLDQLAGLINREQKKEGRRETSAPADAPRGERPRAGIGAGTELTLSEQDAIRAHVERYWRAPADMADPARLVVRVRFQINADGSVAGQPEVLSPRGGLDPAQRAAVDSALRALRVAEPLPVARTRTERTTFTMNFDPRLMAGMQ